MTTRMNDYTHALVKEVSAQLLGYEPSHVWGKLTQPLMPKDLKDRAPLKSIMVSREPHHLRDNDALKLVKQKASDIVRKIPKSSHINVAKLTGDLNL